ncbi:hypothetical protein PR048_006304 [Dryococelus australis]|uniref:Uncharacterized protein n=1 Tax=Dryococelus australis TaxID=614101 RepID=A0ABQ9IAL7_9NEOP|nr:hypothetical protein PR048_006304 [Dryococelus australis]
MVQGKVFPVRLPIVWQKAFRQEMDCLISCHLKQHAYCDSIPPLATTHDKIKAVSEVQSILSDSSHGDRGAVTCSQHMFTETTHDDAVSDVLKPQTTQRIQFQMSSSLKLHMMLPQVSSSLKLQMMLPQMSSRFKLHMMMQSHMSSSLKLHLMMQPLKISSPYILKLKTTHCDGGTVSGILPILPQFAHTEYVDKPHQLSNIDHVVKLTALKKVAPIISLNSQPVRIDQVNNCIAMKVIITSALFLAHQGLAFRANANDGDFCQLLLLRENNIPELNNFTQK